MKTPSPFAAPPLRKSRLSSNPSSIPTGVSTASSLLETGVYLKGAIEFKDAHKDQPPADRDARIQAESYLKYEKAIRNLNVQEARLQRQRVRDLAELKRLQEDRSNKEMMASRNRPTSPQPEPENGFEFSTTEQTTEFSSTTGLNS